MTRVGGCFFQKLMGGKGCVEIKMIYFEKKRKR
jgi:hypothetical protein